MDTNIIHPAVTTLETSRKWYEIWWDVWRHPGVAVFESLLKEEGVTARRGFAWVAVTALLTYPVSELVSGMVSSGASLQLTTDYVGSLVGWSILAMVVKVIEVAIVTAICHWLARRMGGQGAWDQLVFCFAAVEAPYFIINTLFDLLPIGSLWSLIVLGAYFALCVSAIRGVEKLGTGKALVAYAIPMILLIGFGIMIGM